jgi:hypothetical protein
MTFGPMQRFAEEHAAASPDIAVINLGTNSVAGKPGQNRRSRSRRWWPASTG